MRVPVLLLASLVALALPFAAAAQVDVRIAVPVPTIRFEVAPPVVEVEPGVTIVENHEEEIFVSGGWYWCRRDGHWFRTRDWREPAWAHVEPRYVPAPIFRVPPGHYRRWRREEHKEWKEREHAFREGEKAERREEKRERHEEKREEKRERHEERREHGDKHGRD